MVQNVKGQVNLSEVENPLKVNWVTLELYKVANCLYITHCFHKLSILLCDDVDNFRNNWLASVIFHVGSHLHGILQCFPTFFRWMNTDNRSSPATRYPSLGFKCNAKPSLTFLLHTGNIDLLSRPQ